MLKRYVGYFILVFCLLSGNCTVFAQKNGDIINYVLNTDIVAYINHYPITSYNIDGYTAVIVEDLANYGFDIVWNGDTRTLNISRNNSTEITPYGTVYKNRNPVGTKAMPVLFTDIKTYIDGNIVKSYNINGKTIIYFDSLSVYGKVVWVPEIRAIKMWIDSLPIAEYKPLQVSPDSLEKIHFTWSYGWYEWEYDLNISVAAYEIYQSISRKTIGDNYSYYVIHDADDEYLAELAKVFKKTGEDNGFSEWEIIHLVVSFIQNLEYVSDKVSTGYDEYPKFPLETLMDKGGDCEDTSILLASLLRELGYGTILLAFDNHMAVGIKGAEGIPGYYFKYYGMKYYYIETTNSGWDVGDMPPELKEKKAKILPLAH